MPRCLARARGPAEQFEWRVNVIFPDDALGVVFLGPGLLGVSQHDLNQDVASSSVAR